MQVIDSFCFEFGITPQKFWKFFEAHRGPRASGKIMLPWFLKEVTPDSRRPQVYRFGLETSDLPGNLLALLEAQALSVLAHGNAPVDVLMVDFKTNEVPHSWLQLWSDVLGVELICEGAGEKLKFIPDLLLHQRYLDVKDVYLACESHVLSNGPSPDRWRTSFEKRWGSFKNS